MLPSVHRTSSKWDTKYKAKLNRNVCSFNIGYKRLYTPSTVSQVGQVCVASLSRSTQKGMRQHPKTKLEKTGAIVRSRYCVIYTTLYVGDQTLKCQLFLRAKPLKYRLVLEHQHVANMAVRLSLKIDLTQRRRVRRRKGR